MQLTGLAIAAALSSGVLASNMIDELHGHFNQRDDVLLMPRQANLQPFTGALGGIKADAVVQTSDTARPFSVNGDTFPDLQTAADRSCDNQKNNCAAMANEGKAKFQVSDCDTQNTQCKAAITNQQAAAITNSGGAASSTSPPPPSSTPPKASSSPPSSSQKPVTTPIPPPVPPPAAVASTPPPAPTTASSAPLELVSQNAEFNFFCEA